MQSAANDNKQHVFKHKATREYGASSDEPGEQQGSTPCGEGIEMPTPQQWIPAMLGMLELLLLGRFSCAYMEGNTVRIRYEVQSAETPRKRVNGLFVQSILKIQNRESIRFE